MTDAVKNIIEHHIEDIDNSNWDAIHKALQAESDLMTHLLFIRTMLETGIDVGNPNYDIDQFDRDIITIKNINADDFKQIGRQGKSILLYLTDLDIGKALTNLLRITQYILEDAYISGDGKLDTNMYIELEDIYDSDNQYNKHAEVKCPFVTVFLPSDVLDLAEGIGPLIFNAKYAYDVQNDETKLIDIEIDKRYKDNINRALHSWLEYFIDIGE